MRACACACVLRVLVQVDTIKVLCSNGARLDTLSEMSNSSAAWGVAGMTAFHMGALLNHANAIQVN